MTDVGTTEVKTITIDGVSYDIDALPANVKSLIGVHGIWSEELKEQRLAVAKTEAALRSLAKEIIDGVTAANAEGAPE